MTARLFPKFYEKACNAFPSIDVLIHLLSKNTARSVVVYPFPLPPDLEDHFLASIGNTPEKVLDPLYRAGVSQFAMDPPDIIQSGVEKLKSDLNTGAWHAKYQPHLHCSTYDAGYRFFVAKKKAG